ncbi:MAG: hypothetical protein Q9227_005518 [Pyrenula ochraceoflavens]
MSIADYTSIPPYCDPTSNFLARVSSYFHVCIPTPLAFLSTLSGILSILSWLFAQLPQIYKNIQLQSTAGLSIFFLVEWCLGDATNLLGALFTDQATWQVVVAGYYVFVDVCLVFQFFWYTYTRPWLDGQSLHSAGSSVINDDESALINGLSPINSQFSQESEEYVSFYDDPPNGRHDTPAGPFKDSKNSQSRDVKRNSMPVNMPVRGLGIITEKSSPSTSVPSSTRIQVNMNANPFVPPRAIVYGATICALVAKTTASPTTKMPHILFRQSQDYEVAGTFLAWSSTALYLFSRFPQLYKNWSRKSTSGLSPLLFAAAFCGNFFYSLSLLTNPFAWNDFPPFGGHGWADSTGSDRQSWTLAALPFFLGAFGVLALDGAMGIQFWMYGERDVENIVKVRNSQYGDDGRWEVVSGYMRGWVPHLGPERKVTIAEGSQLLSRSRHSEYGTISYDG